LVRPHFWTLGQLGCSGIRQRQRWKAIHDHQAFERHVGTRALPIGRMCGSLDTAIGYHRRHFGTIGHAADVLLGNSGRMRRDLYEKSETDTHEEKRTQHARSVELAATGCKGKAMTHYGPAPCAFDRDWTRR